MNLRDPHAHLPLPDTRELVLETDAERLTLACAPKPEWTSAMGRDRYGLWCEFRVEDVIQRMRWISPGNFLMGSPEDEEGRYDREGPQHPVTITRGYWLFDTPVTQALWVKVMKENPSQYQIPDRPVDSVSWHDSQAFIRQLNELKPNLDLSLPREAEWEYACRAGSKGAVYAGDRELRGENDAPALDAIAWYGGNSGVDFDLEEGVDSSGWKEKQHEHQTAGTRRVAQKQANPWGLYDMLGNVWEWCEDGMRDYRAEAVIDPAGSLDEDSSKVLRGGSWIGFAQYVRSAYRLGNEPDARINNLGFRGARVQREPSQAAEPQQDVDKTRAAGSGRRPRQAKRK